MNEQDRKALEEGIEGWQEFCNSLPSDIAAEKKKEFLAMAKRGEQRPNFRTHPLGPTLCSYTNKKSDCYDPVFDKQIRKEAPSWFKKTAVENKKELLAKARLGKPKPNWNVPLGKSLHNYTNKHSTTYDPVFDKQIRKEAPSWFNIAANKKKQLLEIAKRGKNRPHQKTPLGRALCNYTNKNRNTYDSIFDKQIRKEAPHWFVDTATENKKKLLAMAKRGESRPNNKTHPLGSALSCYTSKKRNTYDSIFDKQIRKEAPHWFKK